MYNRRRPEGLCYLDIHTCLLLVRFDAYTPVSWICYPSHSENDWLMDKQKFSLHWRHNERDGFSNHWRLNCVLNRLFRRRSKKTSTLRVASLGEGNSPVIGWFPAQRASNSENVSIWWRHYVPIPGATAFRIGRGCPWTALYRYEPGVLSTRHEGLINELDKCRVCVLSPKEAFNVFPQSLP